MYSGSEYNTKSQLGFILAGKKKKRQCLVDGGLFWWTEPVNTEVNSDFLVTNFPKLIQLTGQVINSLHFFFSFQMPGTLKISDHIFRSQNSQPSVSCVTRMNFRALKG